MTVISKVSLITSISWSASLEQTSSAAFTAAAAQVVTAIQTSSSFTKLSYSSSVTIRVVRFTQVTVVSSGRRRRDGEEIEAEIELSGKTISESTNQAIEDELKQAVTDSVGETTVSSPIVTVKDSGCEKLAASIMPLVVALISMFIL